MADPVQGQRVAEQHPAAQPTEATRTDLAAQGDTVEVMRLKNARAVHEFADPFASAAAYRHFYTIAELFAASSFVPKVFQGRPGDCLIAFNIARRMGEDPLMVMQQMFVVHGTPGFRTQFMIGRANVQGRLQSKIRWRTEYVGDLRAAEAYGDAIEAGKSEEEAQGIRRAALAAHPRRLAVKAQVADWSSGQKQKREVTYELPNIRVTAYAVDQWGEAIEAHVDAQMAIDEDWIGNLKYRSMPEHMFRFRSAAFLIREYVPEVLMGMALVEELETMPASTPEAAGTRTAALFDRLLAPTGAMGGGAAQVLDLVPQGDAEGAEGADGGGETAASGAEPPVANGEPAGGDADSVESAAAAPVAGSEAPRPRFGLQVVGKLRALLKQQQPPLEEATLARALDARPGDQQGIRGPLGAETLAAVEGEPGEAAGDLYTRALGVVQRTKAG